MQNPAVTYLQCKAKLLILQVKMRFYLLRKRKLEFLMQFLSFPFSFQKFSARLLAGGESQHEKILNGHLFTIAFDFVGDVLELANGRVDLTKLYRFC